MSEPLTLKSYDNKVRPTWCPGCGDFAILTAIKRALLEMEIAPHEACIVSGIGCGSKLPDYMRINGLLTLHGRPLPVAQGIRYTNPDMTVMVVDGDGDAYGIGGNHMLHALRRNPNITHIVENNQIYALTKGQYSPTSELGFRTTTSPEGAIERPVIPTAMAFSGGGTFIARGSAGEPKHLTELIKAAINHPGYALIDVLQPCVTYNKINTYEWYAQRVYRVDEVDGYDPSDREQAWERAQEWGDRIPIGILYQEKDTPTYEEQVPGLQQGSVVTRKLDDLSAELFEGLKEALV